MVRKKSFSPREICIWVRFDRYNTVNRSCSGGGGEGGGVRERKEEGRQRRQWEERREREE